jgi:flagellar basal body-associated protein FliL
LAFQASAVLTAAAEAMPGFSVSAESEHERRMAVGMIVGIVIGVAATIAAIAFAVAFFVLASPRESTESSTAFHETEMNHEELSDDMDTTFVTPNVPHESGSGDGI